MPDPAFLPLVGRLHARPGIAVLLSLGGCGVVLAAQADNLDHRVQVLEQRVYDLEMKK